jgi:WD40 repeat protein
MVGKAERAKRRRRWVLAAVISVLAIGLAIVGGFWWQAEESRRRAEKEALRAEASKLLTLGRLELEDNPTAALAYVRKSLELADSPGARRFALEILWRGPVATILPARAASIGFSPDGQFMAVGGGGGMDSETLLYDADGRRTLILDGVDGVVSQWFALTPDNRLLVRHAVYPRGGGGFVSRNDRWLLPEGQQLAPIEWSEGFEDGVEGRLGPNGLLTFTWHRPEVQFEFWPTGQLATDSPLARTLGSWSRGGEGSAFAMNAGLTRVAWRGGRDGDEVFLRSLDLSDHSDPRRIGRHRGWIDRLSLSADGGLLASRTKSELKIWSLDTQGDPKVTDLKGLENPETYCPPLIDPDSSRIAQVSMALQSAFIWDLEVPLDHRPQILPRRGSEFLLGASHPSGDWLATTHYEDVAFWPQNWPSVRTLDPGQDPGFNWMSGLAFSPDSKWLASCSAWTPPHLWPMEAGLGPDRILGSIGCLTPAFDPPGENLLVTKAVPPVAMVPIDESEPRILPETGATDSTLRMIYALGLSPSGRRAAAAVSGGFGAEVDRVLRIWDLASEEEQVFDQMQDCLVEKGGTDSGCGINSLQFASEDTLFTAGDSGIRQWNLDLGHSQWVLRDSGKLYSGLDLGPDGRFLVTIGPDAAMDERSANRILLLDLEEGTHRTIESRGEEPSAVILDASGQILVSGDSEGTLYVGPVEGGESHLLLGHDSQIVAVALSPDGQWIASATSDEIRVWPMPDLNKKPLHTLPYDEFLAKLRDLTNLLAVEDPESSSGWKLEVGPFPGWKEVPSWQE